MSNNKAAHSQRLEKWLGRDRIEDLSRNMRGWYGPPITLLDVPGGVRVHGDGDFSGPFERGFFYSAQDAVEAYVRRFRRNWRTARLYNPGFMNAGFASLSDAIAEMSGGKRQYLHGGMVAKVGTAPGQIGACATLWYVGNSPTAGTGGYASPGGRAWTDADNGAMMFANPATGGDTTHLVGADMMATTAQMSCLLYDRIFSVAKNVASGAAEAVTGVPTRYQSTTPTAADYAGGNFLIPEIRTVLPATAHNWGTCTYTDQDGNTGAVLPTITGLSSGAANRLDMPTGTWFAPLAAGDTGVKALTQMMMSATLASGAVDFTIGHPLGIMAFPIANWLTPFDWITNRDVMPRIFDDACCALLHLPCSANTATTFAGTIYIGQG